MTYRTGMRLSWLLVLAPLAACGPDNPSSACKDTLLAGDLVITEVFADFAPPNGGTGTDDGKEWFEFYNNTERPVSLKGVTVVHSRPDGSKSANHTIEDVTVAPGQYFTLGNATQDLVPAYIDYGFAADLGDFFNTDGGKLALKCGDDVIDEAVYDGVKSGHSRQLTSSAPPDYSLNDDQVNWCEGNGVEFESNNFGTPGQESDCAPLIAGACSENGTMRAVVSPAPGQLVVTELMTNPSGDDALQEWVELKALASFDLNGVAIGRISDTTPDVLGETECIKIASGSQFIVAHSAMMSDNGGLPPGSLLATFPSSTALTTGSTTSPGDIQLSIGGAVIDAVTWTKSTANKALQLDPDATTASANDDATNFCDATATYGTAPTPNYGTPGTANGQCATVAPPGKCDMGGGALRDIVKPAANALVISELMPNPEVEGKQEYFEITNVGSASFDLNGLGLDRPDDSPAPNVITASACKPLAPNAYALVAGSSDPAANGGIPMAMVDATFTFSMINTNGSVQVVDPASCTGTPSVCTTIYDKAVWGSTTSFTNISMQLKTLTTTANDVTTNYCPGTVVYGTGLNKGSPRLAHTCP
jgi:hypothetical protein